MRIKYKYIKHIIKLPLSDEKEIEGIVEDLQYVCEDILFVVRKGVHYDGYQDIEEALNRKAIVIHNNKTVKLGYYIENMDEVVENVLSILYTNRYYPFKIIGVCGSNGKSSVVSYLYDMLMDYDCMKIGTHFAICKNLSFTQPNTTPNIITLMHLFEIAKQLEMKYIIMEVSSHAIDQKRIKYITFDYIIYTNISRDHLDYHKTLIHYRYTKYKLIQNLNENGIVIANRDELYYGELKQLVHHDLITYGFQASHFQISDMQLSLKESSFYVNRFFFKTKMLSKFNVYNLCAVLSLLRLLGISYFSIYKRMLNLSTSFGRMELIYQNEVYIYLDYAHTSKALYEVLDFFQKQKLNRLIIVVGCGGEREKEKRYEIGYYASKFCDLCIFSEDNSRSENVEDIMNDMQKNAGENVVKIANRKEALEYAINIAEKNDIILVSGKGNETLLERNGEVIQFNDKDILLEIVGEKVWK